MRFIHSNKQYIERTMYPINPYMNAPAVAPFTMEAFVAPEGFDPNAQELNIVTAFAAYPDVNKKCINLISSDAVTTEIPSGSGRTYAYSENSGSYIVTAGGTITWSTNSTKRNIIILSYCENAAYHLNGSVWLFAGKDCNRMSYLSRGLDLKYIHCENLSAITVIDSFSFHGCRNLTGSLHLTNSLTTIGSFAFEYCNSLTGSLIIPESITVINQNVFYECYGFNQLVLHSGITSIRLSAFESCHGFTGELVLPPLLTRIERAAFSSCSGFTGQLILHSSINYIGDLAFKGCSNFSGSLDLSNITYIGVYAFDGCSKLSGNLIIPPVITSLVYMEFNSCKGFNGTLTINSSMTNLGNGAFQYDRNFERVNCYAVIPPGIDSGNTFYKWDKGNIPIHVPVGSLAAYQAAQYWNEFTNIIDDL